MKKTEETSFSTQIRLTVILFSLASVVFTVVASWILLQHLLRSLSHDRAETLVAMISATAPASLSLKDGESAHALIRSVSKTPQLVRARLFDAGGGELASYQRDQSSDATPAEIGTQTIRRAITYGGDTLGEVEVVMDNSYIGGAQTMFLLAAVGMLCVLLIIVWLSARPIEKQISKPLLAFAVFTRRIRDTKDYSLRVPQSRLKEMRGVVEDFNAMLNEIEKAARAQSDKSAELTKLAFFDQLTGAANRSRFRDQLTKCLEAYREKHLPFAVIGIDLDHFKQLNDTLGHHAGDEYLKEVSKQCASVLKPTDTLARMGGDEFIALLPGVEHQRDAVAIAQRLLQAVEAANCAHTSPNVRCTASIGVGLFPSDTSKPAELMTKVDDAMYRAKSGGRNQVVTVSNEQHDQSVSRPQPRETSIYR